MSGEQSSDFERRARTALKEGDLPATFDAINTALQLPGGISAELLSLLGQAFEASEMPAEAAEAYGAAAEQAPSDAFRHHKAAMLAHDRTGAGDKAFLAALAAQKLEPEDPDVIFVMARELSARGETEILAHYRNRLTASDDPAHLELAKQLIGADNRNPFNLVLFSKLARQTPDDPFIRFKLMSIAREFCDYDTIDSEERWLAMQLTEGKDGVFEAETPYAHLLHCADPRLNRLATNNRDVRTPPPAGTAERRRTLPHAWSDRIRIGYLSSDFCSTHATMRLLRDVLQRHDRARFDVTLYDYTPPALIDADDGARAGWGRIVSIHDLDDRQAAARIRADGIDILVDLKGHTGGSRAQILNHQAAPVHVAWLGFPGSTVNIDLDYIIADRFVLPDSDLAHYHECPCRMPVSYQPNDPAHRPLPPAADRASLGLPAGKPVFASFNAQRKITSGMVDLWAAILAKTPDSILWVMVEGTQSRANFSARMASRGIESERIVFASVTDYDSHIARLQAADLGLDTFPYNGHTTTSDMLWAGLPVLTCRGTNFASRVSESLLNAVGLPRLIADSEAHYVEIAVAMAKSGSNIEALRQHLIEKRQTLPLFDSETFCRDLERGFTIMSDRARKALQPDLIKLY